MCLCEEEMDGRKPEILVPHFLLYLPCAEFTQRLDQARLKEYADTKNVLDLPQIPKKSIPLPTATRFCLTADNFQVIIALRKHTRFVTESRTSPKP